MDSGLAECQIIDRQKVLVEEKEADGKWPVVQEQPLVYTFFLFFPFFTPLTEPTTALLPLIMVPHMEEADLITMAHVSQPHLASRDFAIWETLAL